MAPQDDVIAVLKHDHREIEEMFARFGELPATAAQERRELADAVMIELVRHAVAEAHYLYPAVRRYLPDGDEIADREMADQAAAERTMKELEELHAGDRQFDDVFDRLIFDVQRHVRDAEDNLFPRLATTCDADTLRDLGQKVERAKRLAPTRPHPSAPHKPPLNRLLAPGTGLVDRARDLISGRGRGDR